MQPNFDPAWLAELSNHIANLERTFLDNIAPSQVNLEDIFADTDQTFFAIEGLANFWNARPGIDFRQHIVDLVTGAHNQRQSGLTLVLAGTPRRLSLYVSLGTALTTKTMLEGVLPGIRLRPVPAGEIMDLLEPRYLAQGILTGIPSSKSTPGGSSSAMSSQQNSMGSQQQEAPPPSGDTSDSPQLERVIRGMDGATWTYIVQAHPRPRNIVADVRLKMIDLLASISSQLRTQLQVTQQDSLQVSPTASGSQTKTSSNELVNYRAQYLVRLLERELERLDRALAAGQWIVHTYFGSDSLDDAQRLATLLTGTLAGKDSRPDPVRALLCQPHGQQVPMLHTFLTSDEVATLIQFPREEVPGLAIHDFVRFDVDFRSPPTDTLALGHIQQNGRDIYDTYNISLDALTKHAVVVGVTGSGKTTTVMNLLDRMVEADKPFLVIEPAKTEYRALYTAFAGRADLRIYTLGNEMIAPFRLNPFEFETDDEPGTVSVLTHIDFLKAVFNASFVLYSPMPHVLEMGLHEVYEDKGWDLASGLNTRLQNWQDRHTYPIFPTLTDLYYKVEEVTNRLGYHDEVESNVKAGLKARIGSLRLGSKGLMLDTVRGVPMEQLLSITTIMEMEGIGSDEEKTFVMGLFLARLYEYRRLQSATGKLPGGLQHLMVFEEAHRLLKNTSTQVDSESSNMRAQAIEMFTNMLSEIRAYGQGVLVAEQIPSKLAPDVLKNTNLKITHRLIAQDDRQSVGQTMNLNSEQVNHLGTLAPGVAAIYAEGADHAYLVRLENYKRKLVAFKDSLLKQISPAYASVEKCQEILDIEQYRITVSGFGAADAMIFLAADKLLETERSRWIWANIFLRVLLSRTRLPEILKRLNEYVRAEATYVPLNRRGELVRMVLVRGCSIIMHQRGSQYGWAYPLVEEMRDYLTRSLIDLLETGDQDAVQADLNHFVELYEENAKREQGPHPGCTHCLAKCLYRADVQVLLSSKDIQQVDKELTNENYTTLEERYAAVAVAVTNIADRWLGEQKIVAADLGYCAALYAVTQSDFTEYEQILVGDNLVPYLLEETA